MRSSSASRCFWYLAVSSLRTAWVVISKVITRFSVKFGPGGWISRYPYLRVNASPQKMQEYGLTPESGLIVNANLREILIQVEPDLRRN
jgi:hypothetical protein